MTHPIIDFWFGKVTEGQVAPETKTRWFRKSDAFDEECRTKFAAHVERILAGNHGELGNAPEDQLAFILLCDQIPRNIYRGTEKAFALDLVAQKATLQMLANNSYHELPEYQRHFALMPLMHAEDLDLQNQCVTLFEELLGEPSTYAVQHRDIIARFGRFPHRNAQLGRATTPEETEFLKQPGSSF